MKKTISVVLLLAMFLVSSTLTGCGTTNEKAVEKVKKYTVGIFIKDATTPFWRYVVNGAKAEAEKHGIELIEYAPLKTQNVEEQLRQIEDGIQKKLDAICVVALDSNAIIPVLEKADKAGIPVITFNTRVNLPSIKTFIGVENYQGEYLVAEKMIADLGGKGNIVILEGIPAAQTNIDRLKAIKDVVAKNPGIKILTSQPTNYRRDQAMTVMENILQTNTDINAVFGLNDEVSLGALKAIEAASRKGIIISGFDGALEGLNAVKEGRLTYTLDQSPYEQGAYSVRAAVDILNGKKVEAMISTGGTVVKKDNVQSILDKFYTTK